jgi:hypothetical protein
MIARAFTLCALTNILNLLALSLWTALHALRPQLIARDCLLALIGVHVTLAAQTVLLVPLWISGHLHEPLTTIAYAITALATIPSVWAYMPKENPRSHAGSIALACLFASGMVLRVLQTASAGTA